MKSELSDRVQVLPNKHIRHYWSRVELSWVILAPQSTAETPLGQMILAIRGIQQITFDRYRLTVWKAASFTWEEIEPKILAIIADLEKEPV